MAQHPLVIENLNGPDFRAEFSPLIEALATNNSGPTEPPNPFPFMWWADTASGLLKIRRADNMGWITFGALDTAAFGLASLGANTFTGTQNFNGNTLQRAVLRDYGETINPLGDISGAVEINLAAGNVASATIGAAPVTFTFAGALADRAHSLTLFLTNGGSQSITWPAGTKWPLVVRLAGGPVLGDHDILTFLTTDGGTTWYGFPAFLRKAAAPPTFPAVLDVTPTSIGAASTNHPVNMPATVAEGQLLTCIIEYGDTLSAVPSGWTAKRQGARSGVFVRKADGSEGGTTVNFQTTTAQTAAAQVHRITDWFGDLAGVEINSEVSGASTAPNPTKATPSWGSARTLFLAHCTLADDDAAVTVAPTNYTGLVSTVSGGGTNNGATVGSAYRELEAAIDNPDAFTLNSTENWGAAVLMIRPAS